MGGAVIVDMANRWPEFAERMVFFNTVAPFIVDQVDWYTERGLSLNPLPHGPTGDYRIRQGRDPDQLRAELDTPDRCRRYVKDFYEHRLLASQYSFDEDDYDFMTEPFADLERLASGWSVYQLEYGRPMTEPPMMGMQVQAPTLILYGPDDQVVPTDFPKRCEIAFANRVGPVVIPECGHFLQWERADVFNELVKYFYADLKEGSG